MAKKKRITRKELLKEPDEFYTYSSRLFRYVLEHKKQFVCGLAGLLALVIIVSGVRFFSNRSENKAFALLDQSFAKYRAIVQKKKVKEARKEVDADFQNILDNYSEKEGGKIARLIYANICYKAGDFGKAIELYTRSLKDFEDKPFINTLILKGLGYSHEGKKEYQTAAGYFEKVVAASDSKEKDEALFHLGMIYAEMGDHAKSKEMFNKIIADYPDSIYVAMIKEMT